MDGIESSEVATAENVDREGTRAFLLHVFHRLQRKRTVVLAVGRLETGETFGLLDSRARPGFYLRLSELEKARRLLGQNGQIEEYAATTMDGEGVTRVSCGTLAQMRRLAEQLQAEGVRTYEADLNYAHQYLIDRDLRGSVRLRGPWQPGREVDRVYVDPQMEPCFWEPEPAVLALDIETEGEEQKVLAVSLVGQGPQEKNRVEEVHLVGEADEGEGAQIRCHADERDLLEGVANRVREIDPDVLTGWNVVDFDLAVLQRRCAALGLPFNLGRTDDRSWYCEGAVWGGSRMVVYGRQILDALHLVRATLQKYDDYRLDTVARKVLGRGKVLEVEEEESMPEAILRAYAEDRRAFCEYCLEDARLVRDILAHEGLIPLTMRRSLLTGLPLERAWGSIAAFDFLYVSQLHRRGMVAPSLGIDREYQGRSPGGLVLEPRAGLFRHVFVFDFKSLYPSLIRTFNIDPLAHVRAGRGEGESIAAPNGARFDREPGILPQMLEQFFASREEAKGKKDAVASYAYKIVMNSFYGVLATGACRFASDLVAGAITGFGHQVLRRTRDLIEEAGCRVIYGDTDSVFVDAGLAPAASVAEARARGEELCARINELLAANVRERYGVESRLELEFEKYYVRFLLPTMRGSEQGRAKGYAGLRVDDEGEQVEIVGMEAVRRDWTRLARDLQRELLDQLFHDVPVGRIEARIGEWMRMVRQGEKDGDLVYRKGLRKPVAAYTRSSPPHVQAARLLDHPRGVIRYVITRDGPQPVGQVTAPLDYEHYVQKQIEPLVRTLAQVCPIDVGATLKGEADLFSGIESV